MRNRVVLGVLIVLVWAHAVAQREQYEVQEQIEVTRYIFEARAMNNQGFQIKDLTARDFVVTNRGQQLQVLTADWVDASQPSERDQIAADIQVNEGEVFSLSGLRYGVHEEERDLPKEGRRVVFLFQNYYVGNHPKFTQILGIAKEHVRKLDDSDYVAVFSYDSHLRLQSDFTRDRDQTVAAIERCRTKVPGKILEAGETPSLADYLDYKAAKNAASVEIGIKVIAKALAMVDGRKLITFFCFEIGDSRYGPHVSLPKRYEKMQAALDAAEITLFSVDYTGKDAHPFEGGLRTVAWMTGGTFMPIGHNSDAAMKRLIDGMDGHYVLTVAGSSSKKKLRFKMKLNRPGYLTFRRASSHLKHGKREPMLR